jgi:hypothetical protein
MFFVAGSVFVHDADAQTIQVSVRSVKASNNSSGMSPALNDIKSQLGRLNYSAYTLLKKDSGTGQPGNNVQFVLPDGDQMTVQISGIDGSFVNLQVTLKQAGLKTNFRIVNGGTVIIGGNQYEDGAMVIALSASF